MFSRLDLSRPTPVQRLSTLRIVRRQNRTMRFLEGAPTEVPGFSHKQRIRRRAPRDDSGADPTRTRIGRDLALGAHGRDSAHRGSVLGATAVAARPADGARTRLARQNTPPRLLRPTTTQSFLPGSASCAEESTEPHPDLHLHTAPSARVSCGATRGPVVSKSVPGSQNDWPYARL